MYRFAAILVLAAVCPAEEIRLSAEYQKWRLRLFDIGSTPERQAGQCGSIEDNAVYAGPWLAGSFGLRCEYADPLPAREGRVTGVFRTERLMPYDAVITVGYYKGSQRLAQRSTELGTAEKWTRFEVPIRRLPAGTDRIVVGVGLGEKTAGRAYFAELRVTDEPFAVEFAEDPGQTTRPAPPSGLAASPFIRLEQVDGTWWFVRPDGQAFYSLAVDTTSFAAGDLARGRRLYDQTRAMGFNSLGGWHSVSRWSSLNETLVTEGSVPLIQFRAFETGTMQGSFGRLTNAAGEKPGAHTFPDPYDPAWEAALNERVRSTVEPVKGKPWFGGWCADNELAHRDLHRYVYSKHASEALRQFLAAKYDNIDSLNASWNTSYESFAGLIAKKPDPLLRSGAMYDDFYEFSRELVKRYADTVLRIIRSHDPNHLVFTNRFMRSGGGDWIDRLDLYADYDGVAVNLYPSNMSAGLGEKERQHLELVYERTRKPILLTEWSVPALDSGLYDNPDKLDWSYDQTVDTQVSRARQAAKYTMDLHNLPFIVGSHWFTWRDFDSAERQANRGLFRANDEPWTELQDALRSVHERIQTR